jgi:hypothetical protein
MWEQYGDNHRGVCLIFRRDRLEAVLDDELGKQGEHFKGEVKYTPSGFFGSEARELIDQEIFDPDTTAEAVKRHVYENVRGLFFLKTDDWEAEREYRFLLMHPSKEHAYAPYQDALGCVVVGENFRPWQMEAAAAACENAGVPLKQMWWKDGFPFPVTARDEAMAHGVQREPLDPWCHSWFHSEQIRADLRAHEPL